MKTLPMKVKNLPFLLEQINREAGPLQQIRELVQNSIEAIEKRGGHGEIILDCDQGYAAGGLYKLAVIDTGIGMSASELEDYLNNLSSSGNEQSAEGNYGVGAKLVVLPRNMEGIIYMSWRDGVGHMVQLHHNAETGEFGLQEFQDGEFCKRLSSSAKPKRISPDGSFFGSKTVEPIIDQHGTVTVLLGNSIEENTMVAPRNTTCPERWIVRYINTRWFELPSFVTIKARDGFHKDPSKWNKIRPARGQKWWLENNSESSGMVQLTDAEAYWWVLNEKNDTEGGTFLAGGHAGAIYQRELYEVVTGPARLQQFGAVFGHKRVVIYVRPIAAQDREVTTNLVRTQLLMNDEALPWQRWTSEFRAKLPEEIRTLEAATMAQSDDSQNKDNYLKRIKAIREFYTYDTFRLNPSGAHTASPGAGNKTVGGATNGTGKGVRSNKSNNPYENHCEGDTDRVDRINSASPPVVHWVSSKTKTRDPADMENSAAKYLDDQNHLLINADFPVFEYMTNRMIINHSSTPDDAIHVTSAVREWYEQVLVETILRVKGLKKIGDTSWNYQSIAKLWSEECLTASVMAVQMINEKILWSIRQKLGRKQIHVVQKDDDQEASISLPH